MFLGLLSLSAHSYVSMQDKSAYMSKIVGNLRASQFAVVCGRTQAATDRGPGQEIDINEAISGISSMVKIKVAAMTTDTSVTPAQTCVTLERLN